MPKVKFTATVGLHSKWNGGKYQWEDGTVHDLTEAEAELVVSKFPTLFSYVVEKPEKKAEKPPENKAAVAPENKAEPKPVVGKRFGKSHK